MNNNEILEKLNFYSEIQQYIKLQYIEKFGTMSWYALLDRNQHLEGISILKLAISNLARG
jgi:hypothetical protein